MPSVTHILETSLLVVLAYLLGCTLGYLAHRILHAGRGTRQVGLTPPAERLAATVSDGPAPQRMARPVTLSRPHAGGADDLQQIKGIDSKVEASLYALGIFHVDQIAAWTMADLDWVEQQLALNGRITREAWIAQAKAIIGSARLSA